MNVEFHYYAVHALCLEAGLPPGEAETVARASQYVDDALAPFRFETGAGAFETVVTQNYLFWDESIRRNIYLPFHFLPGDPAAASALRADGRSNPYAVTPNGALAKRLLEAALRDGNPYRVGIALHSFADTWAHQNFTGLSEPWNELPATSFSVRGAVSNLPPAGHLHALSAPDAVGNVWEDPRLVPEAARVDNNGRFLAAAKKIFRYLRTWKRRPFDDEELVLEGLREVWADPSAESRTAEYSIRWDIRPYEPSEWPVEAGVPEAALEDRFGIDGKKFNWLRDAVQRAASPDERRAYRPREGFDSSALVAWDGAARNHREIALAAIAEAGL